MSAFGTRSNQEIFMAAKQGCRRSLDLFVTQNRLLVCKIAQRFLSNPKLASECDDIIQEGLIGMLRALTKFDISKGFSFSTYAVPWIRAYIERYLQNSLIKLSMPTRMRGLAWQIRGLAKSYPMETISESLGIELTLATSLYEMTDISSVDFHDLQDEKTVEVAVIGQKQLVIAAEIFEQLPSVGKAALLIKIGEHDDYELASAYLKDHDVSRYDFDKAAVASAAAIKSAVNA